MMRTLPLATLLLAGASLCACSTWKPPGISYDDAPRQAVLQPDPPKPVDPKAATAAPAVPKRASGAQEQGPDALASS